MPSAFHGQRVVILGLARQGVALARYLAQAGASVVVSDLQPAEKLAAQVAALSEWPIDFVLGEHPESLLDGADLLCLSGGVPADLPVAQAARQRGVPLSNDSQIFLEACPSGVQVIGLTGSAGKTTTTSLVGRMLQAEAAQAGPAARQVLVGGNIGNPLIADVHRLRPGDQVVMELSSFQLELMTLSPHVAAVLNLSPNHLDRHGTLEAYIEAKSRIVRFQPPEGVAVLGWDDPRTRDLAGQAPGQVAYFSAEAEVARGAFLRAGELVLRQGGRDLPAAAVSDVALRGRHNLLNALAACAVSAEAGARPAALRAGLLGFTGVPHRLELVRERDGVQWYNDSIATAPERVVAAVRAFDEPLVVLLGGRDKHLPWDELAALLRERARAVVVFGEAAPLIDRALAAAGVPAEAVSRAGGLAGAVAAAAERAQPGDVVLLSPGGTSYDEFHDFVERGEKFRELVQSL